jgi:glucose-specific phosphotransferase system IIA component
VNASAVSTQSHELLELLAPLSGVIVALDDVADEPFRQRLVGDGVAVDPLSDTLLAPCDARVVQVHRAKHALTLEAKGVEIIVHVGLDTVKLEGAGLTPLVSVGDVVKAGQPLRARSLARSMVEVVSDR